MVLWNSVPDKHAWKFLGLSCTCGFEEGTADTSPLSSSHSERAEDPADFLVVSTFISSSGGWLLSFSAARWLFFFFVSQICQKCSVIHAHPEGQGQIPLPGWENWGVWVVYCPFLANRKCLSHHTFDYHKLILAVFVCLWKVTFWILNLWQSGGQGLPAV